MQGAGPSFPEPSRHYHGAAAPPLRGVRRVGGTRLEELKQENSPVLSIFPVRDDYKMNGREDRRSSAQGRRTHDAIFGCDSPPRQL